MAKKQFSMPEDWLPPKPPETLDRLKILDFRARPDRIVYIIEYNDKRYVVMNNDSIMYNNGKILAENKYLHELLNGDRDVLFARITPNEGILSGKTVEYGGLVFNAQLPAVSPGRIDTEVGMITQNDENSYTTENGKHADYLKTLELLDPNVMEYLEHFLVPVSIAEKMRRIVSINGKKKD
jgi:hypothetical protein